VPADARLRGDGGALVQLRTHDVHEVLAELARLELRHVLVEGGSTLATAFLSGGTVDEVQAYVAPVILGAGLFALGDLGIDTLADGMRFGTRGVEPLGEDVLITLERRDGGPASPGTSGAESHGQEQH